MEAIMAQLQAESEGIVNTTAYFMKRAKTYLEQGNIDFAKACLIVLCENCDNYEESIAFNELTEDWNEMAYLVERIVPASVRVYSMPPRSPAECSVSIDDIRALDAEALLAALSVHLNELSGNGDALHLLNKWECTVFYVDEVWSQVNSGGFDCYLYDRGLHFEKAYEALQTIKAETVAAILDAVRRKFPKNSIPTRADTLQNTLDSLSETGIDFEAEDNVFYTVGDVELHNRLLSYIKENQRHFR